MDGDFICGYDTRLLRENFAAVRAGIAAAAEGAPRPAAYGDMKPKLIAATKTVPAEVINYAVRELSLSDIGENRVQELLDKYDALDSGINIHFIGKLQTNKVKYIINRVCFIHSVDSERLAGEISRRAADIGIVMPVTVEVNIGREGSKSGFEPERAAEVALKIAALPGISVRGIMTMAPKCEDKTQYRKYFRETYNIFVDFLAKNSHNIIEPVLSMGMSDSYREAVAEGATAVRVGTALFGVRTVAAAPRA